MNQEIQKIKNIVNDFFEKMTISVEVEVRPQQEKTIPIDVKTENPQILIGEGGQTLIEIQRLLKAIIKKITKEDIFVDLDINDYKKKKIEYLKELAKSAADEVVLSKKEKILASMPAYERRIVHLELAGRKDITTESLGEEPERKIIIRPYP
jgi:spoIIIJ-associated protein